MALISAILTMIAVSQTDVDEASLQAMQQRAQDSRVTLANKPEIKPQFVATPVFRYSDELRHIEDAGLWVWTESGRPVASLKVERYRPDIHPTPWLYCFVSLSPELVSAEWDAAPPFLARKPGVSWLPLEDRPAATRAGRLVQMRDIARRFAAEIQEPNDATKVTEMRLLSRPLYRYDEHPQGSRDGALFGFTGTGTNPDLLLLIDLPKEGPWQFGLAQSTLAGVTVRLQDKIVADFPSGAGKGRVFDTWTYFLPAK